MSVSTSVDQAEVDVYIDNVIDKYTDPAYIAPRDR